MKHLTWIDQWVMEFDTALRTLIPPASRPMKRLNPGTGLTHGKMTPKEQRHAIGLMRVNHSGEVCAQALYQGQALTAKSKEHQIQLRKAADEEVEHLAWCEQCLNELGGSVSIFNLFWYTGSLLLGAFTGLLGDRVSLGFVAEVERQVEAHLDTHLKLLSEQDLRTRAILEQMKVDEAKHAYLALQSGGIAFPAMIQHVMKLFAKVMTKSAYYL